MEREKASLESSLKMKNFEVSEVQDTLFVVSKKLGELNLLLKEQTAQIDIKSNEGRRLEN